MVSIQPNMQAHDELAALFAQNMTFNPEVQAQDVPRHLDPSSTQQIAYSISQHYNHSTHIPQLAQVPGGPNANERRVSEPTPGDNLSSETILRIHGIDPLTLTPSQVQLFRIAEKPQQRRLLELWSICPPNNGGDIPALAWSSTTVEQEEQLAHLRYDRQQQKQQAMTQSQGGQWQQPETEPYMRSGYEELMRREQERQYTPATEPVYLARDFAREHQMREQQQQQLNMAEGYGAFQQMRDSQMDAMDVM